MAPVPISSSRVKIKLHTQVGQRAGAALAEWPQEEWHREKGQAEASLGPGLGPHPPSHRCFLRLSDF